MSSARVFTQIGAMTAKWTPTSPVRLDGVAWISQDAWTLSLNPTLVAADLGNAYVTENLIDAAGFSGTTNQFYHPLSYDVPPGESVFLASGGNGTFVLYWTPISAE